MDEQGKYTNASLLRVLDGRLGSLRRSTLASQLGRKELVGLAGPKLANKVIRGDWEAYIAPVFKGGKLPLLGDASTSMSDKARLAIASNPSIKLGQKVELAKKVASYV